jgi:transposase-like protein
MAPSCRDRQSTRMRRRYTSEQRSQLIELVASGNATVFEAATRLGVGQSAAYSWITESRKPLEPSTAGRDAAPTFVRLVSSADAADAAIAVRVGDAEIQVRRGFDGELLRAVVSSLAEARR